MGPGEQSHLMAKPTAQEPGMSKRHGRTGRWAMALIVADAPAARADACATLRAELDAEVSALLDLSVAEPAGRDQAMIEGTVVHIHPRMYARYAAGDRVALAASVDVTVLNWQQAQIGELVHADALCASQALLGTRDCQPLAVCDDRIFLWCGWAWERIV
jgi:hypothetical protein